MIKPGPAPVFRQSIARSNEIAACVLETKKKTAFGINSINADLVGINLS